MPRLVDHQERRLSIVQTTCRLIADVGIDNVNMRDIARECGYAGPGVLSHYFPNKDAILLASYELICQRTNERIAERTQGRRGLDALLRLCLEIIPADPLTVTEARVAVAFWQRAQTEEGLRRVGREALQTWRDLMLRHVAEAEYDGEFRTKQQPEDYVDGLLNFMIGLHISSMLDPNTVTGSRQRKLIEQALGRAVVASP